MRLLALLLAIVLCLPSTARAQSVAASLVTIYATMRDGRISQGTGFAVDERTIATSYHVVRGAKHVELITTDGSVRTADVLLRAANPDADLVLLATSSPLRLRPLSIEAGVMPSTSDDLRMIGSAAGIPNSTYAVRLVRDTLISIASFNDAQGRPLFLDPPDLPVLQLAGIIYGGISGGPLLNANNAVIGVLCGSRNEGGAFGWAIPANMLVALLSVQDARLPVNEALAWPPSRLASAGQTTLRSMNYFVRRDESMQELLNGFTQDRNTLSAANNDISLREALVSNSFISVQTTLNVYGANAASNLKSEWGRFQENVAQLIDALERRRRADLRLRRAAARLSELAARSDLDEAGRAGIERVVDLLNRNFEQTAGDTFERMHGIDLGAVIADLRSLVGNPADLFSSSEDAARGERRIISIRETLGRYRIAGEFSSWTGQESRYFQVVGILLRMNYGVMVYVPEDSGS